MAKYRVVSGKRRGFSEDGQIISVDGVNYGVGDVIDVSESVAESLSKVFNLSAVLPKSEVKSKK